MFAVPAYVSVDGVAPAPGAARWASLGADAAGGALLRGSLLPGALRDLRLRRLGMDVPVALGLAAAFAASARATVTGTGAVYYDSVTMFIALLLVASYLELRARHQAGDAIEAIARALPQTAERLRAIPAATRNGARLISLRASCASQPARSFPPTALIDGRSRVEEAVLTGESGRGKAPATRCSQAPSIAKVRCCRVTPPARRRRSALARLVERAANARPRIARWPIASRACSRRPARVAAGSASMVAARSLARAGGDVRRARRVVSVRAVARDAGRAGRRRRRAGRRQVLAVRPTRSKRSRVTHVVFDKTGTLTRQSCRLLDVLRRGRPTRACARRGAGAGGAPGRRALSLGASLSRA